MTPRLLVLLAVLSALGAAPRKQDSPEDSLQRGVAFLLDAQADDGGWHSETYGAMRQGAAITSHVLYALSSLPETQRTACRKQCAAAYEFLRTGIHKRGHVANPDGTDDYPTYSTAMVLIAAKPLNLPNSDEEERALVAFLVSAQLDESRDFKPGNIHYGGWDFSGAQHVVGQTSGTNVSVSSYVLEALTNRPGNEAREALDRAARWLAGCQNVPGDGGFVFTPDVDAPGNKAQLIKTTDDRDEQQARAYGTATCDGLRSLINTGVKPMDQRVAAAIQWLIEHPRIDVVPGFEGLPEELGWQKGLRFYYYAALAKVLPRLPPEEAQKRRAALITHLVSLQRLDGSWANAANRMREDDPLICTCFAVTALGELFRQRDAQRLEP